MGLHPDAAPAPDSPRRPVPRRASPLLLCRSPNFAAKSPVVEPLAGEPAHALDSLDSVVNSLHEAVPEMYLESNLPALNSVNVLEEHESNQQHNDGDIPIRENIPGLDLQIVEPQSDALDSAQPSTHNTSEWYINCIVIKHDSYISKSKVEAKISRPTRSPKTILQFESI